MGGSSTQLGENSVQKDKNYVQPSSFSSLYQFATDCEKCCLVLGILFSILSGFMPPLLNVLYGEFCSLMIDRQFPIDSDSTRTSLMPFFGGGRILNNPTDSERRDALIEDSRAWGLGCAFFSFIQFFFSLISVYLLNVTASRQVTRIKILFFKSVLCKDLAWFDTKMGGNFVEQSSKSLDLTEKGMGDTLSVITFLMTVAIVNVLISLISGWLLTLVLLLYIIPICISSFLREKALSKLTAAEMSSCADAGRVAEEVFGSIRTVIAFEGESKEVTRYEKNVRKSELYGVKRGIVSGITNGFSWFVTYCCYATAIAYGIRLIRKSSEENDDEYNPSVMIIIFFSMLVALINLGYSATHFESLGAARQAAALVFDVINTKTKINPCSGDGIEGEECRGEIKFANVHFAYPARPSVHILKGINLNIKAGEVVAIVGGSGAGKSTVLQLVQRLYDPLEGDVFLDGQNIKSLKVSWLRQQLGVVGQEPLLFSTTIRENILYGNSSASDEEVEEAAKKANAHNFIVKLKDGYDTIVGQKGSTLSGGQKQRIAIARALIRNPKILILDEATSALDATSEVVVQAALDKASEGRTTLIVTHKLSKLTKVHRIIVLADGVVAESGTHEELVAAGGIYKRLLETQGANVKERKQNYRAKPEEARPNERNQDGNEVPPPGPRVRFASAAGLPAYEPPPDDSPMQYKSVGCAEFFSWSRPEWPFMIIGVLVSLIAGGGIPALCIIFGYLVGTLALEEFDDIIERTDRYAVALVFIGLASGICVFVQMYCFASLGMRLTSRLRIRAFRCMLYQDISYFDDERNKVGALSLRLSQDPSDIQTTMGLWLGVFLQAFASLIIGEILSFIWNWKLSLVILATIPFIFTGVYVEMLFVQKVFDSMSREKASTIAVEVISNMPAVASLGKESYFTEKYAEAVRSESKKYTQKKAWLTGFVFAIGQTAPFFAYAVTLWYGGLLVAKENVHYKYVVMIAELLIFGAWTLGQSIVPGPKLGRTRLAAGRLKYIFARQSRVVSGEFRSPPVMGNDDFINYSKVFFAYPTRPEIDVLKDFNLRVKSGESVAVMGSSGSGKSTVIQLLLRFYDPKSGSVSISDTNIRKYRLSTLRRVFGVVSQEPVLFERTIHENIAYGDNTREVSATEVVEAAMSANIHSFIMSLPMGYDTQLGFSGAQLSGGQKQRVAIARALVRNPQVLLLDEATSALDPESENVVQEALDKASEGRTTITVAHRFSAVRNADVIHVMDGGVIKESGTHGTLMQVRGIYYAMHEGVGPTNEADT